MPKAKKVTVYVFDGSLWFQDERYLLKYERYYQVPLTVPEEEKQHFDFIPCAFIHHGLIADHDEFKDFEVKAEVEFRSLMPLICLINSYKTTFGKFIENITQSSL